MLKRPNERTENISGGGGYRSSPQVFVSNLFCKTETLIPNWIRKESTLMFERKLKSEIHMR